MTIFGSKAGFFGSAAKRISRPSLKKTGTLGKEAQVQFEVPKLRPVKPLREAVDLFDPIVLQTAGLEPGQKLRFQEHLLRRNSVTLMKPASGASKPEKLAAQRGFKIDVRPKGGLRAPGSLTLSIPGLKKEMVIFSRESCFGLLQDSIKELSEKTAKKL